MAGISSGLTELPRKVSVASIAIKMYFPMTIDSPIIFTAVPSAYPYASMT
ncbi:hypothetical protein [Photobacterium angustum]|nr:hypothetical protein [Photobacterium angustum]